jgi:membrane-bound metal-dependent hydrolase YbcI (DUF457 family)
MPSPVGHALGGIVTGVLLSRRIGWKRLVIFGLAGALPDIDFLLPMPHRGPSHSIGATAAVFAAVLVVLSMQRRGEPPVRLAAAIAAAYGSHVLLDWLGADTWTPHGLMALWPLSSAYYVSGFEVFTEVSRRYWLPDFWRVNALAVVREMVILGPLAWLTTRRGPEG